MSIDARVKYVHLSENGPGHLVLEDRPKSHPSDNPGNKGQPRLHFLVAPEEVTALNGLDIWGGSDSIMLGEKEIAVRISYTEIVFRARQTFLDAVAAYHERRRNAATNASLVPRKL